MKASALAGSSLISTPMKRTFRIGYPSLNDPNDTIALDFNGTVPLAGIPTTLVIDRSGRVAARIVGQASYNGLEALIDQLRAERG